MDEEEEEEMMCSTDPSRFVKDPDFGYQEFAQQKEDHFQVLRVQVRSVLSHTLPMVTVLHFIFFGIGETETLYSKVNSIVCQFGFV